MFRFQLNYLMVATNCFVVGNLCTAARSADYRVDITIDQTPTAGSDRRYAVRAVFNSDDINNKLVAPNGREFDYRFGNQRVEHLTFQQMASLAFGSWTATTGTSTALFHFAPFGLDDVDSEIPVITSPIPGSEVPPSFTLNWQSEADGFVNTLGRSNVGSVSIQNPMGCCLAHLDMNLIGPGNGSLQLEVFTRSALADPMVISKTPSNTTDTYTIDANFRSHSAPASFVIVPEPSATLLAVIAVFGIVPRYRRNTVTAFADAHSLAMVMRFNRSSGLAA